MYTYKYIYGRKTKYLEDLTVYLPFSSILSQPPSQVTWPNQSHIYEVAEWGKGRPPPQVRGLLVWSFSHPTT